MLKNTSSHKKKEESEFSVANGGGEDKKRKPGIQVKNSQKSKTPIKNLIAQEVGLESEMKVQKYLDGNGFEFLAGRIKTPFAEVDLIFRKKRVYYIVEVKSLGSLDFSLVRVSSKQKNRLLSARDWLESRTGSDVVLAFAYVLRDGEILILNESLEELDLRYES